MLWLRFVISSLVIVAAGIRLTRDVDILSDRLGLGKVWIGALVLGLVTSLPEAITSLSAVIYLDAGDLAVGNIMGSNSFNPMLMVLMDAFYRQGSVTNAIRPAVSQKVSAILASAMILGITAAIWFGLGKGFSWGMVLVYFGGMWCLSKSRPPEPVVDEEGTGVACWMIMLRVGIAAAAVVIGAFFLTASADRLAETTGLGETFFGSVFLACVTSLPEMVVSLSAVGIGSFDLAIGNIFGSNMSNVFIAALCDLFYSGDGLWRQVAKANILMGGLSLVLTLILMMGIHKRKKVRQGLGTDSWLMLGVFLGGVYGLYQIRGLP